MRQPASMELTPLESDFLGDLAQDDHALFEVFFFVRAHHRDADDAEVLRPGRELVATWLQRGWLAVLLADGLPPRPATGELLAIIDRHGVPGTYGGYDAPRLVPGPGAYRDVEWIGPAA